jgi:hypothetical protein
MGDRGNIRVIQSDGEVWLYTHWQGSDLPRLVANALRRGKSRWGDETYLTRIIFSELVMDGGGLDDTTGYGIGCSIGDNENPIVVVNCNLQVVSAQKENGDPHTSEISFANFVTTYAGG